jgi:hypothetical protein
LLVVAVVAHVLPVQCLHLLVLFLHLVQQLVV